jgi:hypothetical protein
MLVEEQPLEPELHDGGVNMYSVFVSVSSRLVPSRIDCSYYTRRSRAT